MMIGNVIVPSPPRSRRMRALIGRYRMAANWSGPIIAAIAAVAVRWIAGSVAAKAGQSARPMSAAARQ